MVTMPISFARRIRLLIVEPDRSTSDMLRYWVLKSGDYERVFTFATLTQAKLCVESGDINVSLVRRNGNQSFDFVSFCASLPIHVPCLMIAPDWDQDLVLQAFCHGARGVISEQDGLEPISKAIKCVHEGQVWVDSQQLVHLVGALQQLRKDPLVTPRHSLLSNRESQIAMLLVEGYTNQEIASRLRLSKFTVKNHVGNLFSKLGVSNRTQAVSYLIREATDFGLPSS